MDFFDLIKLFAAKKLTYSEMQFAICSDIGEIKMVSHLTPNEIERVYAHVA